MPSYIELVQAFMDVMATNPDLSKLKNSEFVLRVQSEIKFIACKLCGRQYPTIVPEGHKTFQGHDCAAGIIEVEGERRLIGYYGSDRHDQNVYQVLNDLPVGEPICDTCIDTMLSNKELQFLGISKDIMIPGVVDLEDEDNLCGLCGERCAACCKNGTGDINMCTCPCQ